MIASIGFDKQSRSGLQSLWPAGWIRTPNVLRPAFGAGQKYKKLLLNDGDFMNEFFLLNPIELLTILQLITIRNSSDGNNIKPQAIKLLVK